MKLLVALVLLAPACRGPGKAITSADAAELAAGLANAETDQRFDHRPFSASDAEAVFQPDPSGRKRWQWSARVGFGLGDMSANVSFNRDGSQPSVLVQPAMSMPQQSRLLESRSPVVPDLDF